MSQHQSGPLHGPIEIEPSVEYWGIPDVILTARNPKSTGAATFEGMIKRPLEAWKGHPTLEAFETTSSDRDKNIADLRAKIRSCTDKEKKLLIVTHGGDGHMQDTAEAIYGEPDYEIATLWTGGGSTNNFAHSNYPELTKKLKDGEIKEVIQGSVVDHVHTMEMCIDGILTAHVLSSWSVGTTGDLAMEFNRSSNREKWNGRWLPTDVYRTMAVIRYMKQRRAHNRFGYEISLNDGDPQRRLGHDVIALNGPLMARGLEFDTSLLSPLGGAVEITEASILLGLGRRYLQRHNGVIRTEPIHSLEVTLDTPQTMNIGGEDSKAPADVPIRVASAKRTLSTLYPAT